MFKNHFTSNKEYLIVNFSSKMSSSSLSVLITRLRDLRQEYSDLIAERRNQPPAAKAANEEEEVEAEFQRNVLTLKKKLELVKKSVPEGARESERPW